MDIYREHILDHYNHPRNKGVVLNPDAHAEKANTTCGDTISLSLKVVDGTIAEAQFEGHGCAISQASASLLTEKLQGMTIAQAEQLSKEDILTMLGIEVTPARLTCAVLPLETLRAALGEG